MKILKFKKYNYRINFVFLVLTLCLSSHLLLQAGPICAFEYIKNAKKIILIGDQHDTSSTEYTDSIGLGQERFETFVKNTNEITEDTTILLESSPLSSRFYDFFTAFFLGERDKQKDPLSDGFLQALNSYFLSFSSTPTANALKNENPNIHAINIDVRFDLIQPLIFLQAANDTPTSSEDFMLRFIDNLSKEDSFPQPNNSEDLRSLFQSTLMKEMEKDIFSNSALLHEEGSAKITENYIREFDEARETFLSDMKSSPISNIMPPSHIASILFNEEIKANLRSNIQNPLTSETTSKIFEPMIPRMIDQLITPLTQEVQSHKNAIQKHFLLGEDYNPEDITMRTILDHPLIFVKNLIKQTEDQRVKDIFREILSKFRHRKQLYKKAFFEIGFSEDEYKSMPLYKIFPSNHKIISPLGKQSEDQHDNASEVEIATIDNIKNTTLIKLIEGMPIDFSLETLEAHALFQIVNNQSSKKIIVIAGANHIINLKKYLEKLGYIPTKHANAEVERMIAGITQKKLYADHRNCIISPGKCFFDATKEIDANEVAIDLIMRNLVMRNLESDGVNLQEAINFYIPLTSLIVPNNVMNWVNDESTKRTHKTQVDTSKKNPNPKHRMTDDIEDPSDTKALSKRRKRQKRKKQKQPVTKIQFNRK